MGKLILSGKIENGCKFEVRHSNNATSTNPENTFVAVLLISHFNGEIVDEGDMLMSEIGAWLESRLQW